MFYTLIQQVQIIFDVTEQSYESRAGKSRRRQKVLIAASLCA